MTDHVLATYPPASLRLVSGHGATVTSSTGKTYVDLVAGIAVSSLGHGHPALVDALSAQARKLIHTSNLYENPPAAALAEKLWELTGGMRSFFCNSGAEAVEAALKIARKYGNATRRSKVVCARGGFHGRTFGSLSATGQPDKKESFLPLLDGFVHVPFGDAAAIEVALQSGDVAACFSSRSRVRRVS